MSVKNVECNKLTAIFYGNCHLDILKTYLENNLHFSKQYICKYYFVHEDAQKKELYPEDEELQECDLLIAQDIRDSNRVGAYSYERLKEKTTAKCICIKIPNVYGMNLYFPQIRINDWQEIDNKHIGVGGGGLPKRIVHGIIGQRDYIIEELIKKGYRPSDIMGQIESMYYWTEKEIQEKCNKQLEKLELRERDCDIKIHDYIKGNYKKKKLFYDPFHPISEVIYEKGRRILGLLHIDIDESEKIEMELDQNEIFVYGCVKQILGLEFNEEVIRKYNYEMTLRNRAITLNEYIEDYVKWIS